ncbi:MAG: hypothetical protein E6G55_08475 [Actinobacteria bacterium]|nr:MAG: hypothetical protein E6G55_08475 [Actinomycetota bacterium]
MNAKYKDALSTIPTGSFNFIYGKFKLQSDGLDWLVVTTGDTAYVQGTASIRGGNALWSFQATVRDAPAGTPDHLLLEVWLQGMDKDFYAPVYRASGDVGGQIQIQR